MKRILKNSMQWLHNAWRFFVRYFTRNFEASNNMMKIILLIMFIKYQFPLNSIVIPTFVINRIRHKILWSWDIIEHHILLIGKLFSPSICTKKFSVKIAINFAWNFDTDDCDFYTHFFSECILQLTMNVIIRSFDHSVYAIN